MADISPRILRLTPMPTAGLDSKRNFKMRSENSVQIRTPNQDSMLSLEVGQLIAVPPGCAWLAQNQAVVMELELGV